MPYVLVAGAVIQCSHGGRVELTGGSEKVTIGGSGVLVSEEEAGVAFQAAPGEPPYPPCTNTTGGGSPAPCKTVAAEGGISTTLTVGGVAALLATANGKTLSEGTPGTWKVADAGQDVLTSD